nr:hypothetical protein CFP56_72774 [Quercus suber]
MDAKTSMRIIIIAVLFFLVLSSALVVSDPNNVVPRARKKSSLRDVVVQMKLGGLPPRRFSPPGYHCELPECEHGPGH